MAYLLDANVFITAKQLHYGFDFCPGFWDWIHRRHLSGLVYSIEQVHRELKVQPDEITAWAADLPEDFFIKPDGATAQSLAAVSAWATSQNYRPAAVSDFLGIADYHLVAHAHQGRHTVVTYEQRANSEKRIKIPDACAGLGIECIRPHEMLRRERALFVLAASA